MIYSGWSLTIFMDAIWWQQHLHNSQSARSRNGNPRVSQLALVVLLITSAGRLHPGCGRRGRRRPPTVIATPTPTRPLKPGWSTPQFTGVNRTRYLRRSSWVLPSIRILPSGKKDTNISKEVIFIWNCQAKHRLFRNRPYTVIQFRESASEILKWPSFYVSIFQIFLDLNDS